MTRDQKDRDMRVIAVLLILGVILLITTALVFGGGPEGKEQATLQEQMMPKDHPHPEEISDGQWLYRAAWAGGLLGLLTVIVKLGLKYKLAMRMRRMREEAERNRNRSLL